ncbi:MAG TPA: hypothetical protein VKQ30_19020 [Ktedonobacterales bacterium]|nr:hypothetical protein [Ktedonobacterales bacterium]
MSDIEGLADVAIGVVDELSELWNVPANVRRDTADIADSRVTAVIERLILQTSLRELNNVLAMRPDFLRRGLEMREHQIRAALAKLNGEETAAPVQTGEDKQLA